MSASRRGSQTARSKHGAFPTAEASTARRSTSLGTAVLSVDFSRTGDRLVTAGADTTARVWDAATGRMLYTLRGHASTVNDASFDPSGRWVVTAGRSIAGLWDRASRQRLLFLPGGEAHMFAASFDPAGLQIMTVGVDGTVPVVLMRGVRRDSRPAAPRRAAARGDRARADPGRAAALSRVHDSVSRA